MEKRLKIAFIHPDLCIGGAERLIIDTAIDMQNMGHKVVIFTSRYSNDYCFKNLQYVNINIREYGGKLPLNVKGRLRAPCTILRMTYISIALLLSKYSPDIVFCDIVPHILPLIRFFSKSKIIYYCHYPDSLMTPVRNIFYNIYRYPIDKLELFGLKFSDKILVNSKFTANAFRDTFPGLAVTVLYPSIDLSRFTLSVDYTEQKSYSNFYSELIILSLNRFDPNKNLEMLLYTLSELKHCVEPSVFNRVHLIIAGAFDKKLSECLFILNKLKYLSINLGLKDKVEFQISLSDKACINLLQRSSCLLYTSLNEHFGIGIIEAMAAGKPVVAVNKGGPLEIITSQKTGFLCDPNPKAFALAVAEILSNPDKADIIGKAGQKKVAETFSRERFGKKLKGIIKSL